MGKITVNYMKVKIEFDIPNRYANNLSRFLDDINIQMERAEDKIIFAAGSSDVFKDFTSSLPLGGNITITEIGE